MTTADVLYIQCGEQVWFTGTFPKHNVKAGKVHTANFPKDFLLEVLKFDLT